MEERLIIKRSHISFDENHLNYLNEHSNFPLSHDYLKDEIFAKICHNIEDYNSLTNELKEVLGVDDDVFEILDEEYFNEDNLIIMFSDERSGSNKLELKDISLDKDIINISIEREKGLTMDMAYLFMFIKTKLDGSSVKATIETKEGGFF